MAGLTREFAAGGSALYLNWDHGRDLLGVNGPHVFLVRLPHGEPAVGALWDFCESRHLMLESNAQLAHQIDQLVARAAAALWSLLAVAFLVTGLGILNTLTVNVAEQARDFGLLRALGLTRLQTCWVVLGQALLLGMAGLLPGLPVGLVLAWFMRHGAVGGGGNTCVNPDPTVLIGTAVGTLVVTVVATLGPVLRVSRRLSMEMLADS